MWYKGFIFFRFFFDFNKIPYFEPRSLSLLTAEGDAKDDLNLPSGTEDLDKLSKQVKDMFDEARRNMAGLGGTEEAGDHSEEPPTTGVDREETESADEDVSFVKQGGDGTSMEPIQMKMTIQPMGQ